jgi:hypothetical protein
MTKAWIVWLALLVAPPALGAADTTVEALQMPVWLVRAGERRPLEVGARLREKDEIHTGLGSRALLRLADGSRVKLGENAQFRLDSIQPHAGRDALFKATLSLLAGAFRFTTDALYKFHGRREIGVHFRTATVGIRGTDLWGKSQSDRDIVVLIEGRISVERNGEPPVVMSEPKTVYQAPHGAGALPVIPVDADQLRKWAAETEIEPGRGAARDGGRWHVYLFRSAERGRAEVALTQVRAAGYPARVSRVREDGASVWWVDIGGLPDRHEAGVLADKLRHEFAIHDISIVRD